MHNRYKYKYYYENQNFLNCFENFKTIFNNLQNFIFEYESLYTLKYKIKKFYNFYFPFEDRLGSKTPISIPTTHYDGKNIWLVKAPDLNRGRCIKVTSSCEKVRKYIKSFYEGILKGYSEDKENDEDAIYKRYKSNLIIVQKYIEKPLLYRGRKFDIRIWVLLTHKGEVLMFKEGHLKACSESYSLDNNNQFCHITNYSLQKHSENFSKYEYANEISYKQFIECLNKSGKDETVFKQIINRMKELIEISMNCVGNRLRTHKKSLSFQIFGYDFIIDQNYKPWILEINYNPGLQISSKVIENIVPRMIDDAFRITIDSIFETVYSDECVDKENNKYISPYHVEGYTDDENIFEFICNIDKDPFN